MAPQEELRFDNRVVIVTGAGAGLGRAYALLFGKRGASVVVNDLGGTRSGDGMDTKVADSVVEEIRSFGGKAVANYNSVTDGDKIVQTALENFGRIDIIVNNAGILRDRSFPRISEKDWDIIHDVHVKGAFKVTQAAWPHFKKQRYGRVIMTSSNSGIYGNFGQANYSAAKMGLIGLNNTLAVEGANSNIHCNVIVPTAASRLTQDVMPPELFDELKPELIAPVVVWLCHEDCEDNGSIIESAAGWFTKCAVYRGNGCNMRSRITDEVTPEKVRDTWNVGTDMNGAEHYSSMQEATMTLATKISNLKEGSQSESLSEIDSSQIYENNFIRSITYALGIGATVNESNHLKYLYEGHESFCTFPTQAILPGLLTIMSSDVVTSALPKKDIDMSKVLHGEQYLKMHRALPTSGKVISKINYTDVVDKGRHAVVLIGVDSFNESGDLICEGQISSVIIDGGGFGGQRNSSRAIQAPSRPSRSPDKVRVMETNYNQAALYRLSGDLNPLHIDPDFALLGGHQKPILHGLCTLGISVLAVIDEFAGGNSELFKSLKVRFSKPFLPGDKMKVNMWQQNNFIFFETVSADTNNSVITDAFVELTSITPPLPAKAVSNSRLKSDEVFLAMKDKVQSRPDLLTKINGIFVFNITSSGQPASTWTLDLKSGNVHTGEPSNAKADTTLTMDDSDFVDMATGKLKPQVAFMKGKLKVKGNLMLTQKLKDILGSDAKL